jgi:SagB-type dehydrogenase family enzyme
MSALAWVLLPLLLCALLLAALALAGRLPARPVLNAWSSLLLLAYLGTTAALGIFWVARQQLPVFDWHYLFGYATLLLLAVHLAFNLRALLAHLRRRTARAAPPVATLPGRRPLAGALGVGALALAAGGAYWLGLRHGRTELVVAAGAGGVGVSGVADPALALVEQYHAVSSHSRAGLLRRAPSVDWGAPPPPFKPDAGRPRLDLPPPWRTRPPPPPGALRPPDARGLATLLWHAAGVTAVRGGLHLRAAPSAGALFATELYLLVREVDGVPAGVWHYDVPHGALRRVAAAVPPALQQATPAGAGAAIVATALFRRTGHKYGDRTYRYVLADLGHLLENLRAAAAALATPLRFAAAFDEAALAAALGIDEAEQGVLALAWLYREPPADAAPGLAAAAPVVAEVPRPDASPAVAEPRAAAPPGWQVPLPDAGAPLGLTDAVHRATSLRRAPAVPAAPPPAPAPPPPAASPRALPAPAPADPDILPLIAQRRSLRRYRDLPLGQPALAALLRALHGPGPLLSDAVRTHLVAHAVEGLPAAAWRCDPAAGTLHPSGVAATRARTRSVLLGQDVAADAAAVLFWTIDRAAMAADPAGAARGYRHAFLEAGLAGERLYLHAGALGLGVCAIGAYYDDEAAALIGVDPAREWVVHAATLGRLG